MKDLTKGDVTRQIFFFALPMLFGNVFQQLYNTVDGVIVGRFLGDVALAAVGASFPIIFLMVALVMGLGMGSTILIAQFYGAKRMEEVKKTIDTLFICMFIFGIILSVVGILLSRPILILLKVPSTPESDVLGHATIYLQIIFGGLILMFGYNMISAVLRGLGDSKTPLYFLIIATVTNVILDLLFVLVFKWGIAGAAFATVLSQGLSFLLGIIYLNRYHDIININFGQMRFDWKIFLKSMEIGLPSGIQQTFVALGMVALSRIVNPFGTKVIAGFTAAGRVSSFAMMPAMNFGMALTSFVGQNLGAGKEDRVHKGLWSTVLMSSAFALLISTVVWIFGSHLITLFNTDPKVVEIGSRELVIEGSFYIVVSAMFVVGGVMRGAGDTFPTMIISLLALWGVRIPVAIYLSPRMGPDGIWWSIPIGFCVGLILSVLYYLTGRWKKKVVAIKVPAVPEGETDE